MLRQGLSPPSWCCAHHRAQQQHRPLWAAPCTQLSLLRVPRVILAPQPGGCLQSGRINPPLAVCGDQWWHRTRGCASPGLLLPSARLARGSRGSLQPGMAALGPRMCLELLLADPQGWGISHSVKTQPWDSLQFLAFSCFMKPKLHPEAIPTEERGKIELKEMSNAV